MKVMPMRRWLRFSMLRHYRHYRDRRLRHGSGTCRVSGGHGEGRRDVGFGLWILSVGIPQRVAWSPSIGVGAVPPVGIASRFDSSPFSGGWPRMLAGIAEAVTVNGGMPMVTVVCAGAEAPA